MKRTSYVHFWLLYACVILAIIISEAFNLISTELNAVSVEPRVIEKEVIVYIEKEPDPEPEIETISMEEPIVEEAEEFIEEEVVYEPVITEQPLDYNFDIMVPSGYTVDDLYRSLGGIRNGIEDTLQAIVDAESIYGINSLYLLSVLGFESGWGTTESGMNNIAGWKGGPNNTWSNYNSRYECVMDVAEGLSTDFVYDVGSDIYSVSARYTPDAGYVDTLLQIMFELKSNI